MPKPFWAKWLKKENSSGKYDRKIEYTLKWKNDDDDDGDDEKRKEKLTSNIHSDIITERNMEMDPKQHWKMCYWNANVYDLDEYEWFSVIHLDIFPLELNISHSDLNIESISYFFLSILFDIFPWYLFFCCKFFSILIGTRKRYF